MHTTTPQQTTHMIVIALEIALDSDGSCEGVKQARAHLQAAGASYTSLQLRPAALDCDGLYEPGFQLVMRTAQGTFSAVACDSLCPAVQVQHGDELLLLSDFS